MVLPGPDWYQIQSPYYRDSVIDVAAMRAHNVPVDRAIIGRQEPTPALYMYDASNTELDDGEDVIRITGQLVGAWVKVQGGTVSGGAVETLEVVFAYDDTSPKTITTLLAGDMLIDTELEILIPFDDASATLQMGVPGDIGKIVKTTYNKPTQAGNYGTDCNYKVSADETLILTINPAASTQGSGRLVMQIRRA